MRIIVKKNYEEMSKAAANIIASKIILNDTLTLGLATGSTPVGTYQNLVKMYENGEISFKNVRTVNLDEYKDLPPTDVNSYRYFMNDNLFNHVDIDKNNTFIPDGLTKDGKKECERYNKKIEELGPISIQLLGIGENGHIGFNEPADYFPLETHMVKLTESTIEANKRFFDNIDDVPKYAYTMGIKNIMMADTVLILATGSKKAEIMKKAFQGPIVPQVPASILQLHRDVIIMGDEEAMKLMNL